MRFSVGPGPSFDIANAFRLLNVRFALSSSGRARRSKAPDPDGNYYRLISYTKGRNPCCGRPLEKIRPLRNTSRAVAFHAKQAIAAATRQEAIKASAHTRIAASSRFSCRMSSTAWRPRPSNCRARNALTSCSRSKRPAIATRACPTRRRMPSNSALPRSKAALRPWRSVPVRPRRAYAVLNLARRRQRRQRLQTAAT
ncbi:hypothetical protein C8J36_11219 [Rhizobium sp. PP-F2F-G48]|nr:hypothetical protein C8J36_11219 [Rhizobium sp. PP-F2F-G48]